MNCSECRPLLSELLDEELAPALEGQVRKHCEECAACGSELRQLALATRAFKAAPRDEPPPRLAGRILEALPAALEGRAERPLESPRKWRFVPWGSAAAAMLLAALALLWEEQARRGYASKAADLGERFRRDLALEVKRATEEKASLEVVVASTRRALEEVRESSRASSIEREKEEAAWRAELEGLNARLNLQADQVRELERSLDLARKETARVRNELAAAIQSPREAGSPETTSQGRGTKEIKRAVIESASPGAGQLASLEESARRGEEPQDAARASVRFRRRGELLQLQMTGPRRDLIPELLRIAGEGTDEMQASLALSALEGLLGGRQPSRSPEPESDNTPAGLWNRGVGFLAAEIGLGGSSEGSSSAAGTDRAKRLRRLEELWREAQLGPLAAER